MQASIGYDGEGSAKVQCAPVAYSYVRSPLPLLLICTYDDEEQKAITQYHTRERQCKYNVTGMVRHNT